MCSLAQFQLGFSSFLVLLPFSSPDLTDHILRRHFAALRGYDEQLAAEKQRTERVTKRILTEEEMSALSDRLMQVTKGMTITEAEDVLKKLLASGMTAEEILAKLQ